ncbi:MAG: ClpXP protease specificity-enhancing factor SspB [Bradymonadia bacterium]
MDRLPTFAEREKRSLIEKLLDEGKILVHFDPRTDGSDVPDGYEAEPAMALNFSHHFPFANITTTPHTIEANLSFGGVRHWCVVPLESIFSITACSTEKQVWYEDALPKELLAAIEPTPETDMIDAEHSYDLESSEISSTPKTTGSPHLKLVK